MDTFGAEVAKVSVLNGRPNIFLSSLTLQTSRAASIPLAVLTNARVFHNPVRHALLRFLGSEPWRRGWPSQDELSLPAPPGTDAMSHVSTDALLFCAAFRMLAVQVEWRNEDRLTDYCGQTIKGKFIHCPKDCTVPRMLLRLSKFPWSTLS